MIPGDTILDSQRQTWTISQSLGRGLWGQSWLIKNHEGREAVLKTSLRPSDFPSDIPLPDGLGNACAQCLKEQFTLLESAKFPFLPKLEGLATLSDGRRALILTRYRSEPLISDTTSMEQVISRLLRVSQTLERNGRTHGNLRPTNILWNERDEPVLTDLLTPTANKLRSLVQSFTPQRQWDVPPEAQGYPIPVWDTWAICLNLFRSLTATHEHPQGDLPRDGIDKLQLAVLKDLTVARLKHEGVNLRFVGRVTDKTAAMINRGLSAQASPSPPYRFTQVAHLRERLGEIYNLAAPKVDSVGKVLFTTTALDNVFTGDSAVRFSVSIGCSRGITSHDDIVCGVQLIDLDADGNGRVHLDDIQFDASTHASGRLRFRFSLPTVLPGRFELKVAFSIKGAGQAPTLATGTFEVRPQPGYVPPSEPVQTDRALTFPPNTAPPSTAKKVRPQIDNPMDRFPEPSNPTITPIDDSNEPVFGFPAAGTVTSPESFYSDPGSVASDPGGELIEGFFPKPIAPSQADSLPPMRSPIQAADSPYSSPPTQQTELDEEPPIYEPQRMAAMATPTAPPVEHRAPQQPESRIQHSAEVPVPSAYAPPVTNFNQGQPFEPIVPSSPYASQVRSEPGLGSTGIAEIPEPAGSGAWFNEAAAADAGFNSNAHFDSILPGAHDIEDLPTCTETRELHLPRFRIALHKAVRIAQDDLYVATILAATACMSGILLLTLMMKSCG